MKLLDVSFHLAFSSSSSSDDKKSKLILEGREIKEDNKLSRLIKIEFALDEIEILNRFYEFLLVIEDSDLKEKMQEAKSLAKISQELPMKEIKASLFKNMLYIAEKEDVASDGNFDLRSNCIHLWENDIMIGIVHFDPNYKESVHLWYEDALLTSKQLTCIKKGGKNLLKELIIKAGRKW